MQDLNDKVTGNTLTASEWNEVPSEIQNVIEGAGITLSGADLTQLRKAIKISSSENNFYTSSGTDTVSLTSASTATHSAYFAGMTVNFIKTTSNTTASVTVNVDGLGAQNVYLYDGSQIGIGQFIGFITLVYDGTDFIIKEITQPLANDVFLKSVDSAGTGTIDLIKASSADEVTVGVSTSNLIGYFDDIFLGGADEANSRISIQNERFEVKNSSGTVQIRSFTGDSSPVMVLNNSTGSLEDVGLAYMFSETFTADKTISDAESGGYFEYLGTGSNTFQVDGATNDGTFVVANAGSGTLTISEDTSTQMDWLDGSSVTSGDRTLAVGGVATIHVRANGVHRIWGVGLS